MSKNSTGVRPSRRTTSSVMPATSWRAAQPSRQRDRGLDMAVPLPVGIEMRRLRRQADVVDQLRDDVLVPLACDARLQGGGVDAGIGGTGWRAVMARLR